MERWHLVTIALVLVVAYVLAKGNIFEHMSQGNWFSPPVPGWSGEKDLHSYDSGALTRKPYGFPAHQGACKYWKDRPKSWAVEYSEARVKGDIDTVRSNSKQCTAAPTETHSVSLDYYHDPVGYCTRNPDRYPCPNYWLRKDRQDRDFRGYKSFESDQMYIPKMISGVKSPKPEPEDGGHYRVVERHREDHGKCGNSG